MKPPAFFQRRWWLYVVWPGLLMLLLFPFRWNGVINSHDEGVWLAAAQCLTEGKQLYRDVWFQYGPALMGLVRLAFKCGGETLASVRAAFWLANWAGLIIVYACLLRFVKNPLLVCAASLFIFLVPMASHVPCIPMSTRYGIGFLPLLFWPFKKSSNPILAGVGCSLSFFTSQETGLACIAASLLVFVLNREKILTRKFLTSLCFAMGMGFAVLHFTSGVLPYLNCTFPGIAGLVADQRLAFPRFNASALSFPWQNVADVAAAYLPLLLYPLALFLVRLIPPREKNKRTVLIGLAVFGILMLFPALGRSDRWHIYIAISPLILTFAFVTDQMIEHNASHRQTAFLAFICCGTILFLPHYFGFHKREKKERVHWRVSDVPRLGRAHIPYAQANAYEFLNRWAQKNVPVSEPVLFYPYDGAFYFLVDRPNPSRIPILSYVSRPEQQQQVINELEKANLQWVVWDTQNNAFDGKPVSIYLKYIEIYLRTHYVPRESFGPFLFLKRKN